MKKIIAILLTLALCLGLSLALAEGWKAGDNVYIHVPAKAGGGTDIYTRYLTQALTEICPGVNFIVQNYDTPEIAMETVKNADPDGLTLGLHHGGEIIQYLTGISNVSLKDDLQVVALANLGGPQAIIAQPNAPFSNFTELGEYIKEHPYQMVVGCTLGGTTHVLFTNVIEALAGDASLVNFVQCGSEADKLTQVASRSLDLANCSIPNALNYEQDGKLTIIGTIGPKVSTLDAMKELTGLELGDQYKSGPEQGYENVVWDSNYYVFAPKGISEEMATAINEAVMAACDVQSYIDGNRAMATYIDKVNYPDSVAAMETEWEGHEEVLNAMGLNIR